MSFIPAPKLKVFLTKIGFLEDKHGMIFSLGVKKNIFGSQDTESGIFGKIHRFWRGSAVRRKGESPVEIRRCPATVMRLPVNLRVRIPTDEKVNYVVICEVRVKMSSALVQLKKNLEVSKNSSFLLRMSIICAGIGVNLLGFMMPASAHHAMDGKLPVNVFEGFVSGLAHPVIGVDHFAFVVAVGLLAATTLQGIMIPVAFVLTAMLGTALHLMQIAVPGVELLVSASLVLFGIFLAMKNTPNRLIVTGLAAIAGLFHGYAYGEAIFGAGMTQVMAYLAGFTVIQLVISMAALFVGKAVLKHTSKEEPALTLRFAGFVILGAGAAFLTSEIVATILPV